MAGKSAIGQLMKQAKKDFEAEDYRDLKSWNNQNSMFGAQMGGVSYASAPVGSQVYNATTLGIR